MRALQSSEWRNKNAKWQINTATAKTETGRERERDFDSAFVASTQRRIIHLFFYYISCDVGLRVSFPIHCGTVRLNVADIPIRRERQFGDNKIVIFWVQIFRLHLFTLESWSRRRRMAHKNKCECMLDAHCFVAVPFSASILFHHADSALVVWNQWQNHFVYIRIDFDGSMGLRHSRK